LQKLFTEMKRRLTDKEDLVLATVVASSGATPRGAGARMLVGKEGRIYGTVGGGMVEYRSISLALEAIENRSSIIKEFTLRRNEVEDIGMICGGDVTIYFRFIDSNDPKILSLCEAALEQFSEKKTTWLITELTDMSGAEIGLYSEKLGVVGDIPHDTAGLISGQTGVFTSNGKKYYAEQILCAGYVYICGGGHVAQELVPVLSHLDFRCIVFEDRPEFATRELFPDAADLKIVDLEDIRELRQVGSSDYIIVLTRGHKFDQVVEEQALRTPAAYIGVIGSAGKKAAVEKSIMEHGFTRADLDRVTAPIGLMNIKAETPAEIAISIAGQLIAFRAGAGVIS
jgi:xanthine dehydrogenase accessory factor